MYILAYVYGDDYYNIPILLCGGESRCSSGRELLLYYCSKARESNTNFAIITLVDKITKSQDIGDIVITLLIDLKKAFDTIDHRILLRNCTPMELGAIC